STASHPPIRWPSPWPRRCCSGSCCWPVCCRRAAPHAFLRWSPCAPNEHEEDSMVPQRLRHSLRQFAARPGLALLLVLILALGIGVNAAMFGITDQVLFRPVPVSEPE